jgi:hypothetical protein
VVEPVTAVAPLYAPCPRCQVQVLEVRWDWQLDTVIGTPRLDPVALRPDQVTACILTGLQTWQLQRRVTGVWTTSHRWRHWPTRPVDGETLPAHLCGRVWDAPPVRMAPDSASDLTDPPF